MNDETVARAVLELTNTRALLEQLDVKSGRNILMNMLAIDNSVNMVIKMLTEPEKGEKPDGNPNKKRE
jgi:hypothetical protein